MVGGDSWPEKRHCLQVVFPPLIFFFEPPGSHRIPCPPKRMPNFWHSTCASLLQDVYGYGGAF